jgi:hypothetical protein
MDGSQLRDIIGQKRPRYKEQYRPLIESISKKGDTTGKGDFSSFGAFYQTYMYAFIIGYKLGKQNFSHLTPASASLFRGAFGLPD